MTQSVSLPALNADLFTDLTGGNSLSVPPQRGQWALAAKTDDIDWADHCGHLSLIGLVR